MRSYLSAATLTLGVVLAFSAPAFAVDGDADGIDDSMEACMCLGSVVGAPVTPQGCDVNQVCPCAAPLGRSRWLHHREYVGCLRNVSRDLEDAGIISHEQRIGIVLSGKPSSCGNP
jgi:hypothetical protein